MTRYTTPSYLLQRSPFKYCSKHDKRLFCAVTVAIALGAALAIYTLIGVY